MNENESADPLEITQGEDLMAYLACGYTQFYETLDIFRRMLVNGKTASYRHLRSKGGRTHVVIALSWDMPQSERIAWQAAFGSDFKREALSLAYAALGQKSPVLLYSSKEEVAPVISILPYESKTKNVL